MPSGGQGCCSIGLGMGLFPGARDRILLAAAPLGLLLLGPPLSGWGGGSFGAPLFLWCRRAQLERPCTLPARLAPARHLCFVSPPVRRVGLGQGEWSQRSPSCLLTRPAGAALRLSCCFLPKVPEHLGRFCPQLQVSTPS